MPYIKDRNGPIYNASGDKPSAAFRSRTERFKPNLPPGPGYKYDPTQVQPDHDYITASNASAFLSRTRRFPDPKLEGPGYKYCVLTDRNPDDPNKPGAYAAFRSKSARMPDSAKITSSLPLQHYAASHPLDIQNVVKSQEHTPSAAFRSKTPRFKDREGGPQRVVTIQQPTDIAVRCGPRDSPKGVAFASSAPRFKEPYVPGSGKVYNPGIDTIDWNVNVNQAGGAVSAFRSRALRFKPRPPQGADKVYNYRQPTDIQTTVGEYMAK